jgi:hypothetical protein
VDAAFSGAPGLFGCEREKGGLKILNTFFGGARLKILKQDFHARFAIDLDFLTGSRCH